MLSFNVLYRIRPVSKVAPGGWPCTQKLGKKEWQDLCTPASDFAVMYSIIIGTLSVFKGLFSLSSFLLGQTVLVICWAVFLPSQYDHVQTMTTIMINNSVWVHCFNIVVFFFSCGYISIRNCRFLLTSPLCDYGHAPGDRKLSGKHPWKANPSW